MAVVSLSINFCSSWIEKCENLVCSSDFVVWLAFFLFACLLDTCKDELCPFLLRNVPFIIFSWNFWYNCDICDSRRVGCNSSICWWFTLHTRICRWLSLLSICWSSFRLQPRWVSFVSPLMFIYLVFVRFLVCLFFRVERVTACGSKVGKMDIVGGPEVCNSSWILCVLELAYEEVS